MALKYQKQQCGYLTVDHRASPGIPADIARLVGYDPTLVGEGKFYEADTLSCRHCRGVVVKNPLRTRERHKCFKCGGLYVCDGCAYLATLPDYDHTPFEKVMDQFAAARDRGIDPEATVLMMGTPSRLLLP
jgi:hypothetical protein